MLHSKLTTVTLGCKVNQYETQFVREGLLRIGYQDAAEDEQADVCIVNTCTITAAGDAKSRQVIRRLARRNPQARIVVMGCYATRAPDAIARLPGVAEVVTDKRELPDLLARFGVEDQRSGITGFGRRHRAYVKVQDGCLLRCSYCIIPQVRPRLESRPVEHILAEVERLVRGGFQEIVLTGIHLGHYGVDLNRGRSKSDWIRLADLVGRIGMLRGRFRVRLSSIEATELTRELIDRVADPRNKVAPHLHVSMQSGSDSVLRRMHRRWGSRRFVDRCHLVRERLDEPALTTDIIVGFPGETERDFERTCQVAAEVGFSKIHIFPFSPRRGTPAAELPDQLPAEVKQERRQELARIEVQLRDAYLARLRGKRLQVLVESAVEARPGYAVGTSCRYAPVELPLAAADRIGRLVDVTAGPSVGGTIQAEPQTARPRIGSEQRESRVESPESRARKGARGA